MKQHIVYEDKATMKVRKAVMFFYKHIEPLNYHYRIGISELKVVEKRGHYQLFINTHYPGILIGKAGQYINKLRDYLDEELGKKSNN